MYSAFKDYYVLFLVLKLIIVFPARARRDFYENYLPHLLHFCSDSAIYCQFVLKCFKLLIAVGEVEKSNKIT